MAIRFISSNIISALGFSTQENSENLLKASVGITSIENTILYPTPFMAAMVNDQELNQRFAELENKNIQVTHLEKMMILSINSALSGMDVDITSPRTLILVSTTKGNIDLLNPQTEIDPQRVLLWKMADFIGWYFDNPNPVRVISNACISGVLAINTAAMILQNNSFDHVVVVGGDLVTRFVVSGFMSFLSLSPQPCKPFDQNRDGLSLGEAAGTVILEKTGNSQSGDLLYQGGASANDANHISGPSRTGEGSFIAIQNTLKEAEMRPERIDHINAHGTATRYNDDMESMAIQRSGLQHAVVNSYKGSWGHTLGAAGIIETAALMESMKNNVVLPTAGFQIKGTTEHLAVSTQPVFMPLNNCLKLASGFGGCNAALIIKKSV